MVPLRAIETASLLLRLTLLVAALTVALGLIDGRAALAEAQAVRGVEETRAHYFAAYRVLFEDRPEEVAAGHTYAFIRGRYIVTVIPKLAEAAAPATPTGWAIHREVVQPLPRPDVVD